ncbi:MAG: DNA-binding protein [Candidatus Gastranaerophilales bacterium]|nr:DNA-binding protein [Candidatus Gastranaerophilales bacterium]
MLSNKYSLKEVFVVKGDYNADLLEQINNFCIEKNIKTGMINAIGAVQNIRLGYFDQNTKQYSTLEDLSEKGPFEIVHCGGNVSLKDGKPFCHLHIVVSDREGKCFGGHLMPGVKVFALEFVVHSFDGAELERGLDETTQLPLWVE